MLHIRASQSKNHVPQGQLGNNDKDGYFIQVTVLFGYTGRDSFHQSSALCSA